MKYRKRTRLNYFSYIGHHCYFITICTSNRKTILTNQAIVENLIKILKNLSEGYNFLVWAYCFMPDHFHLLVEGDKSESDLRKFISMFKQKTGFWYKQRFNSQLWHVSYYDHILRKKQNIKEIIFYIFNNPVKANIVNEYTKYPFLGSFEFDISNFI